MCNTYILVRLLRDLELTYRYTPSVPFNDYPEPFLDAVALDRLRTRVGAGRAATLVGAGFSRNAEALVPGVASFPLWSELIEQMARQLYGPDARPSDPLRTAETYELYFGRQALRDFLHEAVPDAHYRPGRLHRALLRLPWADVFTTNYDTLLEQARPDAHRRSYSVVYSPADLSQRTAPRIVKRDNVKCCG